MKRTDFSCRFSRGDAAVIAAILAAALLSAAVQLRFTGKPGDAVRVVTEDGTAVYPLSRDAEYTIVSGGYTLVLAVRGGEAYVASADCPTKQCAAAAPIRSAGRCIVCLPARVAVTIDGGGNDADFILP